MRTYRWFLIPSITFLFSFMFFSSSLAQERLPEIIKRVQPSVVSILTYNKEGEIVSQGSGFFISKKGELITSRHVLQDATRAEVKTADGKIYPITRVIAEDKEGDIVEVLVGIPSKIVRPLFLNNSIPMDKRLRLTSHKLPSPTSFIGRPFTVEHGDPFLGCQL